MLDAHSATVLFMEDYQERLVYGGEDADEALHNSVNWTLRKFGLLRQATAYAKIKEAWERGPATARFIAAERAFAEVLNG